VETLGRVKNNMRELERKLEEQAARGLDLSQIQSDVEAVRAENVALEEKARRSRRAR
jgi:phage portal protein BeeE